MIRIRRNRSQSNNQQDIIAERWSERFTGREREIQAVTANLQRSPRGAEKWFVLGISGEPGVGKSTLLRQLSWTIGSAGDISAYVAIEGLDPLETMKRISNQFESQGKHLRQFNRNLKRFQEKISELEADPDVPKDAFRLAGRFGAAALRYLSREVPVPGAATAVDVMTSPTAIDRAGQWFDFVTTKVRNRDERRLILLEFSLELSSRTSRTSLVCGR